MTVIDPLLDKGRASSGLARGVEGSPSRDVAMLAHDMRGALQGILGGVALIDASGFDPVVREQMARVFASAETVSCLLNVFLDEEPDPAGGVTYGTVDIESFLDYLGRRWTGEARQKGLALVIAAGPNLPKGLGVDLVSLARIIGNLIGNSIRHTSAGAVQLTVECAPDEGVAFRLCDDGPGVSPAELEKALRIGYRPLGSTGPTHGLGLHIVRELSSQIGGAITLGNRASGGFEAVLTFPPNLCLAAGSAPRVAAPVQSQGDIAGLRVLLAEDNPTNQMVATQMLRALNAEVTLASDGVEALERFETGVYDLVVVDIEMPRMSGLDVIRTIRARRDQRAGVPIVALTAYALREHQDRIAEAGANGLISKPISSIEALGRALAAHVLSACGREAPSPAAVVDSGSVVDLVVYEALRQAIGPDMMAELMEKVIADLISARADLAGALDPVDQATIRSASHILISVAGAIGAARLQSCARDLNIIAHDEAIGAIAAIAAVLRRCLDELDAAVAFAREQRAIG